MTPPPFENCPGPIISFPKKYKSPKVAHFSTLGHYTYRVLCPWFEFVLPSYPATCGQLHTCQAGRGHWVVNYSGTQSFKTQIEKGQWALYYIITMEKRICKNSKNITKRFITFEAWPIEKRAK